MANQAQEVELQSFEKAFEELEAIAVKFERGELKLDESLALFERGMRLAQFCGKKLEEAEKKITDLMNAGNEPTGNPVEK